jgi:hypothetical protein
MDDVELSSAEKNNLMLRSQAQKTSRAISNYVYEKKRKARELNKNTTL